MQQNCATRDSFLRCVHADCPDHLEREVRNDPISEMCCFSSDGPVSRRGYRIYAITMGNKIVTSFFVCITTAQTAVGIYLAILISSAPGMASMSVGLCILGGGHWCRWFLTIGNSALKLPSIHLTAYQLCIFDGHRKVEIVHTAIALFYGLLFLKPFPSSAHSLTCQQILRYFW